ncbi:Hypothetical predicted protein [Octopus vulgaris]|uniref:Uncharacterized protein n=1 Tax=Octopus vulgaris TaxID=6645 RepID=A0AA36AUZ2_OCTVU|nr:Hypothetical predicted protein [Octopus vulgaris]
MDESGLIYGTNCLENDIQPQKEQLLFQYDPADVPSEMAGVMSSIKNLAEKMLFHWREFPIVLPASITDNDAEQTNAANGDANKEQPEKVTFRDVFIAPTFDELEEVARLPNGVQKKLNEKQLYCIWDNGEFEVDSIHFPGQTHKWHLSQLLQKGSKRSHETLLDDTALALRILLITARNRFHSHFFSLSEGIKSWARGLWKIFDIIIGMPSTTPGDLCGKLREEHMRYLVAELDIRQHSRKEFNRFCEYVKEKCKMLRTEKHKTADLRPPPIPYYYQTPQGLHIDLRLFNKDLINNCLPILSNIVDKESKSWHIQYRQKLVRELKAKGLSDKQINEEVNIAVMAEYLQRVYRAVLNNVELENLQHGIGQLLVAQAQSVLAMQKAVQKIQQKMVEHKDKLMEHLKVKYPVKSRIPAWKNEQLERFEEEFINQNLWSAHDIAVSLCEEQDLKQAVYFLRRDLNFIKEREPILRKELGKVKVPTRVFTFATKIWFPQHWLVVRQFRGDTEVVPTIIMNRVLSTGPAGKKEIDTYTVDKYMRRKTSTRYPMWRWWNYVHRTWAWMWNSMFFFLVVIPLFSPVSFRALFCVHPFKPDLELSQVDGVLYPKESYVVHTLISRLRLLWQNVHKSRADFEAAPHAGFLGKSFTRHLNRFWNFVLKGGFGSFLLVLVFPLLCIVTSGLSVFMALTAPVWMPVVTLLAHIGFFLVYDIDCPELSGNKILVLMEAILWHIVLQGCIQPVTALLFGVIICPLAAFFCLLFGTLRRAFRGLWDSVMFHTVIKSRGRIPASDGFIARRVAGPGLASNYFFQIKPEQSLAAIEAKLEFDELEAWKNNVLKVIEYPEEEYRKFVKQCFKPFSADICDDGVYKKLCSETTQYKTDLTNKVELRKRRLSTGLYPDLQRRIKLPEASLKKAIIQAATMLKEFYPYHVLRRLPISEQEFWEKQQLEVNDWKGLACKKLTEIFSKNFLVPLEETDNHFELKVEHLNFERYTDMLKYAEFHDDLDEITQMHIPAADVSIRPPFLDCGIFNPNQHLIPTARWDTPREKMCPWKKDHMPHVFDKLQIPLPIPHPASIALAIYNRENDQYPINFEDLYCQRIIKATKEVPYVDVGHLSSPELFELEPSTPDIGTFGEPINLLSHLAQQEASYFSDDNVGGVTGTSSPALDSNMTNSVQNSSVDEPDKDDAVEGHIVYEENERDSSCIIELREIANG